MLVLKRCLSCSTKGRGVSLVLAGDEAANRNSAADRQKKPADDCKNDRHFLAPLRLRNSWRANCQAMNPTMYGEATRNQIMTSGSLCFGNDRTSGAVNTVATIHHAVHRTHFQVVDEFFQRIEQVRSGGDQMSVGYSLLELRIVAVLFPIIAFAAAMNRGYRAHVSVNEDVATAAVDFWTGEVRQGPRPRRMPSPCIAGFVGWGYSAFFHLSAAIRSTMATGGYAIRRLIGILVERDGFVGWGLGHGSSLRFRNTKPLLKLIEQLVQGVVAWLAQVKAENHLLVIDIVRHGAHRLDDLFTRLGVTLPFNKEGRGNSVGYILVFYDALERLRAHYDATSGIEDIFWDFSGVLAHDVALSSGVVVGLGVMLRPPASVFPS